MARPGATAAVAARSDTRQRLLECAIEILETEGVGGLGLREVARRAGVSHNAPSRHFAGGFRELCTAVATIGFDRLTDALERGTNAAGADAMARLAGNGRGFVGFGIANHGMYELLWRRDLVDFGDGVLLTAAGNAFTSLRSCVSDAQATGWNAGVDTDLVAATCFSWAHGLTQLWAQHVFPGPIGPVTLDQLLGGGFAALSISSSRAQI